MTRDPHAPPAPPARRGAPSSSPPSHQDDAQRHRARDAAFLRLGAAFAGFVAVLALLATLRDALALRPVALAWGALAAGALALAWIMQKVATRSG